MDRKKETLMALLLISFVILASGENQRRKRSLNAQPNIVFIMADDLGWNDVGFHNPKVKTPNIDWLVRNGIELTNHHSQSACSPSRSSLLTGRYPSNNGLHQFVVEPESKSCLPLEFKIWPEYMKELGYVTKYIGKWHLGYCNQSCLPTNRGFDEFKGIISAFADYFTWEERGVYKRYINDTLSTANMGTHHTIQEKRDVREMISAHQGNDSPLFMIVSPLAPHSPLQVTDSMLDVHNFLPSNNTETLARRKYLGLVSALDDLVRETIQALKDTNLYDNTIIVFTSDNGGTIIPTLPEFESFGNNYPLRNGKFSFHDGGTRTPTVYLDPRLSATTRGTKRDFLMHISDWLPTFLQANGQNNATGEIDGISQWSNLGRNYSVSKKYEERSEMLVGLTQIGTRSSECSDADAGYRWRDWKLIEGVQTSLRDASSLPSEWAKPLESPELPDISGDSCIKNSSDGNMVARCLFNLEDDPYEQRDLYDERPDIVSFLRCRINWYKAIRVDNVHQLSLGNTPVTTTMQGDLLVPRLNYCNPSTDFPLRPYNACCANGSTTSQ